MMIAGSVRLPDFFVIGAPKSATTALWSCFAQHRFVPVWHLYSDIAVKGIKQAVPHAKIIVMLRNPVDAAYFLCNHKLVVFDEDALNFCVSWILNESRMAGSDIPPNCREPRKTLYKIVYSCSAHLEKVFDNFSQADVFVGMFEEFERNPRATYQRMQAFLGVPDDGRNEFARVNPNKRHRNGAVEGAMRAVASWKRRRSVLSRVLDAASKSFFGSKRRNALVSGVLRRNLDRGKIAPLDPIRRRDLLRQMDRETRKCRAAHQQRPQRLEIVK